MPEGDTALAAKGAALVVYDESEKSEAKGEGEPQRHRDRGAQGLEEADRSYRSRYRSLRSSTRWAVCP